MLKSRVAAKEDEAGKKRLLTESIQHPPYDYEDKTFKVDDELKKVSQLIANTYTNIELVERQYKDSVQLRRIQHNAARLFVNDMSTTPSTGDPIDDMIVRSREELRRYKVSLQTAAERRVAWQGEQQQKLQKSIAETRRKYKERQRLVEEGPKFICHRFSGFGDVTYVGPLRSNARIVVSAGGVIELWGPSNPQSHTSPLAPISITTFPMERITVVESLAVRDETSAQGVSFSSMDLNATADSQQSNSIESSSGDNTNDEAKFGLQAIQAVAGDGLVTDSRSGENLAEDNGDENAAMEAPQLAPFVVFHYMFFLGTEAGTGRILTVVVTEERETGDTTYELSLGQKHILSQKPILQARYMSENHQLVIIVADSPYKLATFALLALDGDSLNAVWRVPVEKLEQRSSGHIAQITVTPYEPGTWGKPEVDGSFNRSDKEPSCNITAIEYDAQNNTLMAALRSGRVVRLSYETIVPTRERGKSVSATESGTTSNPRPSVAIGDKGTSNADDVRQEISLSVLFSVGSHEGDEAGVEPNDEVEKEPISSTETKKDISGIEIHSMVAFVHPFSRNACVLLGCRDGSVRVVSVDHATVGQELFYHQIEDFATAEEQSVDVSVGFVVLDEEAPLVLAYTSVGTFAVFHLLDQTNPLTNIRVLANRRVSETPRTDSQLRGGRDNNKVPDKDLGLSNARFARSRGLRLLDPENGVLALSSENQWSVVDLGGLAAYLRQRVHAESEEIAT